MQLTNESCSKSYHYMIIAKEARWFQNGKEMRYRRARAFPSFGWWTQIIIILDTLLGDLSSDLIVYQRTPPYFPGLPQLRDMMEFEKFGVSSWLQNFACDLGSYWQADVKWFLVRNFKSILEMLRQNCHKRLCIWEDVDHIVLRK